RDQRQARFRPRNPRLHRDRQRRVGPIAHARPPLRVLPPAGAHTTPARRQPTADLIPQSRALLRQRRALAAHVTRGLRLRGRHPHLRRPTTPATALSHTHHHELHSIEPIPRSPSRLRPHIHG